ncbi:MAG: DUF134 domain-containing protein [Propionivibrio sp.]
MEITMGRPTKERCINCVPAASYYKPVGIPLRELDEIVLAMDELEAMRLTDLEGLYQADAAERMGISRQTIGNILNNVHRKVADALLNGKALRIQPPESAPAKAPAAAPVGQ